MSAGASPKVYILTYYWPPAGGMAVQRWLFMSWYLAEMGWDICIVSSANPDYPQIDASLCAYVHPKVKVLKVKGFEPRHWLKSFFRLKKSKEKELNLDNTLNQSDSEGGLLKRWVLWVRANFFIPDARVYWSESVKKELLKHLKEEPASFIVSTGTPHSTHLAAMDIAESFQIPWLADFRDPWQEIEYFDKLPLTVSSRQKHAKLERLVLERANMVTTVSNAWARLFQQKGARRTEVVYNGYDENWMHVQGPKQDTGRFRILHVGTLGKDRFSDALVEALVEINEKVDGAVSMQLVGNVWTGASEYLRQKKADALTELIPYQSREALLHLYKESDLLLLVQNQSELNMEGRIPAKVFEYMASGKPILMLGAVQSDLALLLSGYKAFYACTFDNKAAIVEAVEHCMQGLTELPDLNYAARFSRSGAAIQMDAFWKELAHLN